MLQKAEILSQLEKRMEVLRKMYTAMPPVAQTLAGRYAAAGIQAKRPKPTLLSSVLSWNPLSRAEVLDPVSLCPSLFGLMLLKAGSLCRLS